MSFSNCKSDKIPGAIRGNALSGLCEKVCIQVDKVFDACMRQESLTDLALTMTDVTPGLTEPYRFVSARSSSTQATVSDLTVTELPDAPCYARVTCTINIPVQVVFTDAFGVQGTGNATITLMRDVIMHVSAPSVIPYSIQCTAGVVSPRGVYTSTNTFTVTACVTTILKVTMPVELLVPSYGYCYIPPCHDFTEEVCSGVTDLPLYPQENGIEPRCPNQLSG